MNKREARRLAHRIAYRFVQQAIQVGGDEVFRDNPKATQADQQKVEDALDDIAQWHYEKGNKP